jgi:malate dehydrogenase (quinone)
MRSGHILSDGSFIKPIDHMSFVWGEENCAFLKKRVETMKKYDWFKEMEFSEDFDEVSSWVPLMMKGRDRSQKVAVSRMKKGKDVNFGAITKGMIDYLRNLDGVKVYLSNEIEDIKRTDDDRWELHTTNLETDTEYINPTDFVFIGAGGAAITLLEDSDIPEAEGYGGFPVSGKFLQCNNPKVIAQHKAKAYGLAEAGSPPMSVPHLDSREIDGKQTLLFGPFAGFSTKFLKNGSFFDLPLSIESHNIWPLLVAGYKNMDLTKYLVEQVSLSDEERIDMLQKYYPEAKAEDWELITAGQRVQIIKKDPKEGGKLQFGTEVVTSSDGSLAALLGASPGASTSVSIMIEVLSKCFPSQFQSAEWQNKLKTMIPEHEFIVI